MLLCAFEILAIFWTQVVSDPSAAERWPTLASSIMASDHQPREALFFLERKKEFVKEKCPKLTIVSKECVGPPPPVVGRANVCSPMRCWGRRFAEFVPRPGISHCTLDRTKNCLTIELRKLVTWSNLGVFL